MRFSAAIQRSQPLRNPADPAPRVPAAADFLRRLVTGQPLQRPQTADELPADLDQRVRLVGEW